MKIRFIKHTTKNKTNTIYKAIFKNDPPSHIREITSLFFKDSKDDQNILFLLEHAFRYHYSYYLYNLIIILCFNRIQDDEECWVEIIKDAYNNRFSLSSYQAFPEPNFLRHSDILYHNKDGLNNNMVLTLCNLLQFDETVKLQLSSLVTKSSPKEIDIIEQLGKALGPTGINSGLLLLLLCLILILIILLLSF